MDDEDFKKEWEVIQQMMPTLFKGITTEFISSMKSLAYGFYVKGKTVAGQKILNAINDRYKL